MTKALPFSLVIWLIASATEEVGTSTITSTPSVSYHLRAMLEPTSGLFWWSAETTSTFRPDLDSFMKSSTASLAATTEPGPPMSAYRPDMSFMTPILTTLPEIWAWAMPAAPARPMPAIRALSSLRFMGTSPSCNRS